MSTATTSSSADIDLDRRINELRGFLLLLVEQMDATPESEALKTKVRSALLKIGAVTYGAAGLGFQVLGAAADLQQLTS